MERAKIAGLVTGTVKIVDSGLRVDQIVTPKLGKM
jgi:hypothetical protein